MKSAIEYLQKEKERAFTILEAIVALAVLAFAIVWVLQVFPTASMLEKMSQRRTQAVLLAQEKTEELISKAYQSVAVGIVVEDPVSSPFEKFKRTTEVVFVDVDLQEASSDYGLKKIAVTVSWPAVLHSLEKTVKITSLIADK